MGRATQGVKLINLKNSDSIAAVAKVMHDEDDVENAEGVETTDNTNLKMAQLLIIMSNKDSIDN